jgi:hypothetical protein
VFFGPTGSGTKYFLADKAIRFIGESSSDYLGYYETINGAGDMDGDGYDEFALGAWYADQGPSGTCYGCGALYLVYGDDISALPSGDAVLNSSTYDAAWFGVNNYEYLGQGVHEAGDVNGDGYADLLIGSYGAAGYSGTAYLMSGQAFRYSGKKTVTDDSTASMSGASGTYEYVGYSTSGAGDVNGDGFDDVIVAGRYGYSVKDTCCSYGRTYLYYGPISGDLDPDDAGAIFAGEFSGEYLGYDVAGGGDINDDGYADFVMGAPYNREGGYYSGVIYVVYGKGI